MEQTLLYLSNLKIRDIIQGRGEIKSKNHLIGEFHTEKITKPPSISVKIMLSGLLLKILIFLSYVKIYYFVYLSAQSLGIIKLNASGTTEKSMFFAPLISPSIQMGRGVSNSILK